ncbi:DNA polymerase III subunit delta [Facilibium subflavum]|uniref:DNA polymerase III subunit delta n=1 Tax=Facilibium subflavum TaxID=2219058 RepID=UPI000E64D1F9|nr:DNA polymerase III subunit delta [Facilibium subflavum]
MKANYFDAITILKTREFPCYIITGDEAFQKTRLIDQIRCHYQQQGFELVTEQSAQQQPGFLYQQHNNLSLFSTQRLLQLSFTKQPDKNTQQALNEICTQTNNKEDRYLLVFDHLTSAQQKAKWFQTLSQNALHIQLWPVSIQEAIRIIKHEINNQKKITLSHDAIALIAQKTEGNLLAADQIIRLLSMQAQTQFDCSNIADFLENFMSYDVFDLTQSIVYQQKARSLSILQQLLNEQFEPAVILWAILRELRIWILLANQNIQEQQKTFISHNIWRSKQTAYLKLIRYFSYQQLNHLMESCFNIDLVIKGAKKGNIKQQLTALICQLHHA